MVTKYVRLLKERAIYYKTGEVWRIQDVPFTWRVRTKERILAEGYIFAEDGTVIKAEELPAEDIPSEDVPVENM